MRPARLFAIIWITWLLSWIVAAFWSDRAEKRLATWDVWSYRAVVAAGLIALSHGPLDCSAKNESGMWDIPARMCWQD